MPTLTVQASFHDGRVATFEGVRIRDLRARAGAPTQVEGQEMLRLLVVEAPDGDRALFSRSEVEPGFGPLQVIVPDEFRHVRWVRQVECIRLAFWRR